MTKQVSCLAQGELVGPIFITPGEEGETAAVQMLPVPRVASMCPAGSQDLERGWCHGVNNSHIRVGGELSLAKVAGIWFVTEAEAGGQGPTSLC